MKTYKSESEFQAELITELHYLFPGCIVKKQDTLTTQGFPDLLVLYGPRWALLECKKSEKSPHQPNQDYYIDIADKMSFGRFIYPENKEEVLRDLQQALRS